MPDGASAERAVQGAAQLLTVRGLSLVYQTSRGPLTALQDLTLDVKVGEFISLLGPSGCGKSSLLKVAAGLVAPTAGEIRLRGTPIVKPRPDVGVVFQKPNLMPWKTVLQNVLVTTQSLHLDARKSRERARELLALVGLADFIDHYPRELSGGMQQRVGLVRGLVHDPDVLLMDEPFAALDAMTREHMTLELQKFWMGTGKSVIFITHSIPEAVFLSDRVLVMSERPGRVVKEIDVGLRRPRGLTTMEGPAFIEITGQLRRHFSQEVALD